jgi:hypothetical protein
MERRGVLHLLGIWLPQDHDDPMETIISTAVCQWAMEDASAGTRYLMVYRKSETASG